MVKAFAHGAIGDGARCSSVVKAFAHGASGDGARCSSVVRVCSWCDGSSNWSFMLDPLSYFSFQPVLHDWCNKGCGMCYPVCGMVHIKDPLLLIRMMAAGFLSPSL